MATKARVITGTVYVVGDNIDTDQIIPAQYLNLVPTIPDEYKKLGSHAMAGLPDGMPPFVESGMFRTRYEIIVAGRNFGCGSSREHAPVALGAAGTKAVVAESYARIFFRNCIATGELYPCETEERLCDVFATGEEAELDYDNSRITRKASGHTFKLRPLGPVAPVVEAGGIFEYARRAGMLDRNDEVAVVADDAPAAKRPERAKVVIMANQKGGVGKTTTTVNLAACVAGLGRRVLLVDLDPQCNSTSGLGIEREEGKSVYGALLGEGNLADMIKQTAVKGLDIIPSEVDLAGAEVDVAREEKYLHRFRDALAPLLEQKKYDYIMVDSPPSLGILTMNGLAAADAVVIPMQCEYYAMEGLTVITGLIEQVRSSGANPNLTLEGILMTMYDGRTRLSEQVVDEVRGHFAGKIYKTVIPRNVRLSEAPSFGLPVMEYDRYSRGARAYLQFAKEFLKRIEAR